MENILDIRAANCIHLFSTNLHDQCFDSCQSNWFLRLLRIPFIFHLPLGPCFSFHFPSFWAAHGALLFLSFSIILGCPRRRAFPFIFLHFGLPLGRCFAFHFPSFWGAFGTLLFLSFSIILGCPRRPAFPFIFLHFGLPLGPCFSFHFPSFWAAFGTLLFLSFSFILGCPWHPAFPFIFHHLGPPLGLAFELIVVVSGREYGLFRSTSSGLLVENLGFTGT